MTDIQLKKLIQCIDSCTLLGCMLACFLTLHWIWGLIFTVFFFSLITEVHR